MKEPLSRIPSYSSLILHPLFCDSLNLRDNFVGDILGCLVVALEVHRRSGATLRHRAEVCGVAEHLRERDIGRDDLRAARPRLHLLDATTPTVQVTRHAADEV